MTNEEQAFRDYVAAIEPAALRDRVEDSSEANASDTAKEDPTANVWVVALATARMIMDAPADFYPELFK